MSICQVRGVIPILDDGESLATDQREVGHSNLVIVPFDEDTIDRSTDIRGVIVTPHLKLRLKVRTAISRFILAGVEDGSQLSLAGPPGGLKHLDYAVGSL